MNEKSTPYQIVYLDRDSLPERIRFPAPKAQHQWTNYPATPPELVVERSRSADILLVNKVCLDEHSLSQCPKVKHIAVTATGYNVIDTLACEARGISVSNIPSYAAITVAEHVIGAAIVLRREMPRYASKVADSQWQSSPAFCLFDKPFSNLSGATIGLIGLGEIGEAVAHRAHALGLRVVFCGRRRREHDFAKQVELTELLETSDIISVHCDLNASTHGLIAERELSLMKENAVLINTARGGIVSEVAVTNAIQQNSIAGIAFDVMQQEPPTDTAPLLSIAHLPNVMITPHIAWASEQAMQFLANTVTENINAFINGNPQNLVTRYT